MAMRVKEHTNLISIFSFIFAGIQGLMFLFFALYLIFMFGLIILSAINAKSSDAAGIAIIAVVLLIIAAFAALGLTTVILNIKLGRRLRSDNPPTQRSMIVTSIFNICSFLCGGVFVLPFGAALGTYGLWFALSDMGKRYFDRIPDEPILMNPPMPDAYDQFRQQEPYKWQ
ncbi:MAG: phage holin family protein [Pyrinomonadaceae bacterium]|nr:phage holin family protein [Pyrinomonadaceae bacterium]